MPEKNWKVSLADAKERGFWDDYMNAFEVTFNHSTEHSSGKVVHHPADNKWLTRTVVADVIIETLTSIKSSYLVVSEEHRQRLLEVKNYWKMRQWTGKQIMKETTAQIDRMMLIFDDAGVETQLTLSGRDRD